MTVDESIPSKTRLKPALIGVLVVSVLASAVMFAIYMARPGPGDLAAADSKGAAACSGLIFAMSTKNGADRTWAVDMASDYARSAETAAIRSAGRAITDSRWPDPVKIHAACVDAGVDMPEMTAEWIAEWKRDRWD